MSPVNHSSGSTPNTAPLDNQENGYGNGYGNSAPRPDGFARLWHALRERVWIVAISTAALLGIGYAYLRTAPVLYSATATVEAEPVEPNILRMQAVQAIDISAVDYLQTVAQSLTSRPLLERVADTNQLWADPRFLADTNHAATHNRTLKALGSMVQTKLRRGTRLIDITATHRVPEFTEQIANSIYRAYVTARAEQEDNSIGRANENLAKEGERLRKKLEQSENALQNYKEQSMASSLEGSQNTVVAKLKELSTKVTEAKSVRIKKETEYDEVIKLGTNIEALLALPAVAGEQSVVALQASLIKAENEFAGLSKRYKDKHPKYIQATTQIAGLKNDVTNAIVSAVKTLKAGIGLESARATEQALDEALQAQEAAALELSKLSIQYSVLAREVESDRALYDAVLKGMKETRVTKETHRAGIIRLVEPAYLPEVPVSPRKAVIMAVCGLAGIFLGGLIVMGLHFTDTSIKTVDEAEAVFGLAVFSVVPNMRGFKNGDASLVVVEKAGSEAAEAFRTLRTSLSILGPTEDRCVFLFTSAMPEEGKTFCAINYAASLAQLGHKTLLIDADLRRPAVQARLLGKDNGSAGLTDYLSGQKKLDQVVQSTKIENLFFIAGGTIVKNPAELLAKDGLSSLIQHALQHYQRVVLDSAPINAVSDTLLMSKNVHSVCLVVRAAYTSSRHVFRCVQLLQSAEASLSGIILNRMPQRRGGGRDAYYDYQHHGKYGKYGVYGDR